MVNRRRLEDAKRIFARKQKALLLISLIFTFGFILEICVALEVSSVRDFSTIAMIGATILGAVGAILNALWSTRRIPYRGIEKFLVSIDHIFSYVLFLISFLGLFLHKVEIWALWANVLILLRWLYDVVASYRDSVRYSKQRLLELSCPEKIEKPGASRNIS